MAKTRAGRLGAGHDGYGIKKHRALIVRNCEKTVPLFPQFYTKVRYH